MASPKIIKVQASDFEDVERMTVKDNEIVKEIISPKLQAAIINQVNEEYFNAYRHTEGKRAINSRRLVLYNNQRKNTDVVSDPLLFTVFNTSLSSLYDDRLMVNWEAREEEKGIDKEENLNSL